MKLYTLATRKPLRQNYPAQMKSFLEKKVFSVNSRAFL